MTISRLSAVVVAGGVSLPARDVEVVLDESRIPFAAADLTLPLDPALVAALDPRARPVPRITVTLAQHFYDPGTLAAVSTAYAGRTLAAVSGDYPGRTLAAFSAAFGSVWNTSGYRQSRAVTLDLGVRSRVVDHTDATVRLVAASDELLLADGALVAVAAVSPPALTVLSAVQLVLGLLLPGYALTTSQGAQAITADAAVWEPGVSGWDYLSPLVTSAGLRLWCDQARGWHLEAPSDVNTPGALALAGTATVTAATDSLSRDAQEWYSAVVVAYRWTDAANVRRTQYDVAGDLAAAKVLTVTYERPYPRAGEAAVRLRKATGHGRVLDVDAVADPSVYPAQPVTLSVPDTPPQSGFVQAVRWSLPADLMTVTTRELVDTLPYAWVFGLPGQVWSDIPVGMSWATFDWAGVAA